MGKPPAHPSGQSPYISYQGSPMMIMDSGTAPPMAMPRGWEPGSSPPEMVHEVDAHFARVSSRLFGSPQGHAPTSSPPTEAGRAGVSWGLGVRRGVCHSTYWKAGGVMVRRQVVHSHEVRRPRFSRPAASGMPRSCDMRSSTHVAIHDQHLVSKWKQLLVTQAQ